MCQNWLFTHLIEQSHKNWIILALTLFIALFLAEFVFRIILFSKSELFQNIKKPQYYASPTSEDDYWLLQYLFANKLQVPKDPHPLLGWVKPKIKYNGLFHEDSAKINKRKPVLLYGDSFAMCMDEVECFEDILNKDTAFATHHFMVNYGVGGYGVDQMSLLLKNSYRLYQKPLVIIGIMIEDLDRSILTFRDEPKPYYTLSHDSLILQGIPVTIIKNENELRDRMHITSFLYRKVLFGSNLVPKKLKPLLKHEQFYTKKKMDLNEKIITDLVKELKASHTDFVFLIFHYLEWGVDNFNEAWNWRNQYLRNLLEENSLPYIWTLDAIRNDSLYDHTDIRKYILPNGHPTTHFNGLIANQIKDHILRKK